MIESLHILSAVAAWSSVTSGSNNCFVKIGTQRFYSFLRLAASHILILYSFSIREEMNLTNLFP